MITRYRDPNANLRTQFVRIINRAGLKPWPKLFQNLRATRETELAGEHPLHVVCDWIGNSRAVAMEHYLQTTDEDFKRALDGASTAPGLVQSGAIPSHLESYGDSDTLQNAENDGQSSFAVGGTGLEPVTSTV